jgi:hypothetical protein
VPGGAPGLQNQCWALTSPGWVRFPFTSAIFLPEQRPMWRSILRALSSVVLFSGAAVLLIYGERFHSVAVSREEEKEFSIAPPTPFAPPPIPGQPSLGQPPFGQPPFGAPPFGQPGQGPPLVGPLPGAPPFLQTIKTKVIVTENESEPTLVREVTFGGVTLTSGTLMRTYTGQPPSLCPT